MMDPQTKVSTAVGQSDFQAFITVRLDISATTDREARQLAELYREDIARHHPAAYHWLDDIGAEVTGVDFHPSVDPLLRY